MNLVYINKIGQNWKGNYVYEFLFSDVLEDIDGDGWDSYPSLGNPEPPEDSIIKKSGSLFTTLKLDLVKDSESLTKSNFKVVVKEPLFLMILSSGGSGLPNEG